MHSEGNLVLDLMRPSMKKMTTIIDGDLGLPQARPSPMKKNVTGGIGIEAHLLGAWETTP